MADDLSPATLVMAISFIISGPLIYIFRKRLVAFSDGVDGTDKRGTPSPWRTRIAILPLVVLPVVGVLLLTGVIAPQS